jgi:2-oxoglutarate dehydrogenase E1 component
MAATESTGLNAAYVAQLREDFLDSPASVPDEWRRIFEAGENGAPAPTAAVAEPVAAPAQPVAPEPTPAAPAAAPAVSAPAVDDELLAGVAAAMALVKAYRMHGHLAARLDPLGSEPTGDPALDETRLTPPLTPELQARIPAKLLRLSVPGETLLEALPRLREVYTGSSAYEIEHISDHAERVWLR